MWKNIFWITKFGNFSCIYEVRVLEMLCEFYNIRVQKYYYTMNIFGYYYYWNNFLIVQFSSYIGIQ